jgi:predicted O-methyltransferase YrrM
MTTPHELPLHFDRYVTALFAQEDLALRSAREAAEQEGLPDIHVSASEGRLLHVLARLIHARRILEVGTLGAYSTIWLARALPDGGRLISLELEPHHATVSRENIERAGLSHAVEIRTGPAADAMRAMLAAGEPPFDLVFIDADKEGYPHYLEMGVALTREGGLILADNALMDVLDPEAESGIQRTNLAAAGREELLSVVVPVFRSGGIDGLLLAVKEAR